MEPQEYARIVANLMATAMNAKMLLSARESSHTIDDSILEQVLQKLAALLLSSDLDSVTTPNLQLSADTKNKAQSLLDALTQKNQSASLDKATIDLANEILQFLK